MIDTVEWSTSVLQRIVVLENLSIIDERCTKDWSTRVSTSFFVIVFL